MTPTILDTGIAPALIFICGSLLIPLLSGRVKTAYMLLLPAATFFMLTQLTQGQYWTLPLLDYQLVLGRIDALSRVFGYIFTLITFIAVIYAMHVKDDMQHVAAFIYAGSALGVTFAGDLLSLYIFWEIMAIASTFLILARRTRPSRQAAIRYVLVHVFGGLCLLAGIVLTVHQNGGRTAFDSMSLQGAGAWLMFIGIAVNAAVWPLHAWLQDAYPRATVTGTVFLSAFTTKSAVYVMARAFPGAEPLIWLGAFMTVLPVFYAEVENDIRRVLSYSLMNQVGFMLCGIGIGTQLAINGAVSHAFCHILYKALLFMAAGSVLHVTGKIKCTEIGGLYRTMPLTCLLCIVGAASISAFPLFSGFVSKSMIIAAAGDNHLVYAWLMLQFASAGVIAHAGIKVPFFTFFGHDSGIRAKEPPLNMLTAMSLAAFLCIFIGVFPEPLYRILPYPVSYAPYSAGHIIAQLELLLFGILAFYLMLRSGFYPPEIRAINLDTDWFYRKWGRVLVLTADRGLNGLNRAAHRVFEQKLVDSAGRFFSKGAPQLMLFLLTPIFAAARGNGRAGQYKQKIARALETGTIPLGISAGMAGIFLLLIYLVS